MNDEEKFADLKMLAMMAARLAGRDPEAHITIKIGEKVVFDDACWRYSDFIKRAQSAYEVLVGPVGI